MLTKSEREELRRLLRSRFKLLRSDIDAREVELRAELEREIEAEFAAMDRAFDDAMFKIQLIVDEANRQINDIGRELYGLQAWGEKHDRTMLAFRGFEKPSTRKRQSRRIEGTNEIQRRVAAAKVELNRQETQLLTELATSALESAESRAFFDRIPSVSDLVPAYRLREITEG